jgi:hypothetical protein
MTDLLFQYSNRLTVRTFFHLSVSQANHFIELGFAPAMLIHDYPGGLSCPLYPGYLELCFNDYGLFEFFMKMEDWKFLRAYNMDW